MAKRCTCEGTQPYGGSKTWCDCGYPPGSGKLGCLTYFITGNVGNCVMLPVWRAIGRFLGITQDG